MSDWTPPPDVLPGYDHWLQTGPGGPLDDEPDDERDDDDTGTWLGLDPVTTGVLAVCAGWLLAGVALVVLLVAAAGWLLARAVRHDRADIEWRSIDKHSTAMRRLGRAARHHWVDR